MIGMAHFRTLILRRFLRTVPTSFPSRISSLECQLYSQKSDFSACWKHRSYKFGHRYTSCELDPAPRRPISTQSGQKDPQDSDTTKTAEANGDKQSETSRDNGPKDSRTEDLRNEKAKVLDAALGYVPTLGWTEAAIAAGAKDVNLSPAIIGAFQRKEAALVEHFMDKCRKDLLDKIDSCEEELNKLVLHDRITRLLRFRLEMQIPYMSKWAQALSIQANPVNLPTSLKQRAELMDEVWHAAGDRSTDWDWYTKRAILGGIYTAAEVYMLTDYSPEYRDTWSFLERRVRDALDLRKTAQEASQLAEAIGAGLGNTISSFLNRKPGT